jgi:hypothetical protein
MMILVHFKDIAQPLFMNVEKKVSALKIKF